MEFKGTKTIKIFVIMNERTTDTTVTKNMDKSKNRFINKQLQTEKKNIRQEDMANSTNPQGTLSCKRNYKIGNKLAKIRKNIASNSQLESL